MAPELLRVELFTTLTAESAIAQVLPSRAMKIRVRFISFPHVGQRRQADIDGASDGSGDRVATAAAVSGGHAGQTIGIGQYVDPGAAFGVGYNVLIDHPIATVDAGKVAVTQFVVGGLHDPCGRVGVDGRGVGVFVERLSADGAGLDVTLKHDDAITLSLDRHTEHGAQCASEHQQAGKAFIVILHVGAPSLLCAGPVSVVRERAEAVPLFVFYMNSTTWRFNRVITGWHCIKHETGHPASTWQRSR
ncbi:hypothetical protein EMIT0P176_300011 [Pseudomonas sp. IT-P176]